MNVNEFKKYVDSKCEGAITFKPRNEEYSTNVKFVINIGSRTQPAGTTFDKAIEFINVLRKTSKSSFDLARVNAHQKRDYEEIILTVELDGPFDYSEELFEWFWFWSETADEINYLDICDKNFKK